MWGESLVSYNYICIPFDSWICSPYNKFNYLLFHMSGSPREGSSGRVTVVYQLHGIYPFPLLWIVPITLHKILRQWQLLRLHCNRLTNLISIEYFWGCSWHFALAPQHPCINISYSHSTQQAVKCTSIKWFSFPFSLKACFAEMKDRRQW